MYRHAILVLACLLLAAPVLGAAPLWTHAATEPVREIAVSSDGRTVVISSDQLHIFDRKGNLTATTWRANDIAVGPRASLIVSASDDGVRATAKNGTDLWTRPNRTAAVAIAGDGKTVAGITPGGMLMVYGQTGTRAGSAETGSTGDVVDLAVSEHGFVIVSVDGGGVHAFNRKGASLWDVELANPTALAINGSGDLVAVGDGGSVKFYNLTGERVGRVATNGPVRSLAMTPSANLTVVGVEDGSVLALGGDAAPLWTLAPGARANAVAVSDSGALVAVASADRRLRLFFGNGTALWDVELVGVPRSLSLSSDGTTVAVGCDDGTASVYDAAVKPAAAPKKGANGTAANVTPGANAAGAQNVTVSQAATGDTAAADETGVEDEEPAAGTTGTAKSGIPVVLPVAALALLAVRSGLRRRG